MSDKYLVVSQQISRIIYVHSSKGVIFSLYEPSNNQNFLSCIRLTYYSTWNKYSFIWSITLYLLYWMDTNTSTSKKSNYLWSITIRYYICLLQGKPTLYFWKTNFSCLNSHLIWLVHLLLMQSSKNVHHNYL